MRQIAFLTVCLVSWLTSVTIGAAACTTSAPSGDLTCSSVNDVPALLQPFADTSIDEAQSYFEGTFILKRALIEPLTQITGAFRASESWGHYFILGVRDSYGASMSSGEVQGVNDGLTVRADSFNEAARYDRGFNTDVFSSEDVRFDRTAQNAGLSFLARLTVLTSEITEGITRYVAALDWTAFVSATECVADGRCRDAPVSVTGSISGRTFITLRTVPVPGPVAGSGLLFVLLGGSALFFLRKRLAW